MIKVPIGILILMCVIIFLLSIFGAIQLMPDREGGVRNHLTEKHGRDSMAIIGYPGIIVEFNNPEPPLTIEWLADLYAWKDTLWAYESGYLDSVLVSVVLGDSVWLATDYYLERTIDTIRTIRELYFIKGSSDSTTIDLGFRSDGQVVWRRLE